MTERLEEHLVARGLLSQERADDALRSQALVGGAMDTLLLEMGAVREQDLVTALGEVSGLQPIYLADYVPNPGMAAALPREDADRLNLAPLSVEDGMLHVAVPYPVPMRGLEALVRTLGRSVAPWVSTDVRVRAWRYVMQGLTGHRDRFRLGQGRIGSRLVPGLQPLQRGGLDGLAQLGPAHHEQGRSHHHQTHQGQAVVAHLEQAVAHVA